MINKNQKINSFDRVIFNVTNFEKCDIFMQYRYFTSRKKQGGDGQDTDPFIIYEL